MRFSHSNTDLFTYEDNMLFSHVKNRVFTRKLTWYFIGVYIINNHNYDHGCRRMESILHKAETSGVCLCEPFVSQMKVDFQQYISILYRSEIIKSRSTESVYQVSSHNIHLHVY